MIAVFRAAAKTGLASLATLLLTALTVKVLAVVLGPPGVGLFSLIRQVHLMAVVFATVGGQTALVQGIASRSGTARREYLSSVLCIFCASSAAVAAILVLGGGTVARLTMPDTQVSSLSALMRWMAIPVCFGAALTVATGVLNGRRAIGALAVVQVFAALMTFAFAYPAARTIRGGNPGAYVALVAIGPLAGALLAFGIAGARRWLAIFPFRFSRPAARHFLGIATASLISGLAATGAITVVRASIVRTSGLATAGIFDAAWTMSMTYVLLLLNSFGTYYLPTLSSLTSPSERRQLVEQMFRFSAAAAAPLIVFVAATKPLIASILYSCEFMPALSILRWTLLGDYFKIFSWVLAMPMLAFADMKTFLVTELLWQALFMLSSVILIHSATIEYIGVAFFVLYVVYFAYTVYYAISRGFFSFTRDLAVTWLAGLACVVTVSIATWSDTSVRWTWLIAGLVAAAVVAWHGALRRGPNVLRTGKA